VDRILPPRFLRSDARGSSRALARPIRGSQREHDVEMNRLRKAQGDTGVSVRGKVRMVETNLIGTDIELACPKEPLIVGPDGARAYVSLF